MSVDITTPAMLATSMLIAKSFELHFSDLLFPYNNPLDLAIKLYRAPVIIIAYTEEADPTFIYANQCAQNVWGITWDSFLKLLVKESTSEILRQNQQGFIQIVKQKGHYMGYQGLKKTASGRMFRVENAIMWTLTNAKGEYIGQASMIPSWEMNE